MNYNTLASDSVLTKTVSALKKKGYDVIVLQNRKEALDALKSIIPSGASVMNGSSRTLEQIGFIDHLKSDVHSWNNLHAAIVAEKDPVKQALLRKQALLSDYYVGSVHALTRTGEMIIASNTASQLPHVVYSSQFPVFVIGTQKIVAHLDEGMKRLEEYVIPLEDENMKQKFGVGTQLNKIVIFKGESSFSTRKITIVIVTEQLGF